MAIKCIYHSEDLDGFCSAAVVKYRIPEAVLIPADYGDDPSDLIARVDRDDTVFVVDFFLGVAHMSKLAETCKLIWIDHHLTAIRACETAGISISIPGKREVGKAACELVWEFLFPSTPLPLAVTLLGRFDVRDHTDPRTIPFQFGMRAENLDPQSDVAMDVWQRLFEGDITLLNSIMEVGASIFQYQQQFDRKYFRRYGYTGRFLNLPAVFLNRGIAGSFAFADCDPKLLKVAYCRTKDGRWSVGLYSDNPDIDCGALAARFGGGGHRGAAGFTCDAFPFQVDSAPNKVTVYLPFEILDGENCWNGSPDYTICDYFDNSGRAPRCLLGFGTPIYRAEGIGAKKPRKCRELIWGAGGRIK